jgi:hypothetical protein
MQQTSEAYKNKEATVNGEKGEADVKVNRGKSANRACNASK